MDTVSSASTWTSYLDHPPLQYGDLLRHFKRETVPADEQEAGSTRYLYRYLGTARNSETDEIVVIYEALYPPFGTWVRPVEHFMSEVDHEKYPDIKQKWRFEQEL